MAPTNAMAMYAVNTPNLLTKGRKVIHLSRSRHYWPCSRSKVATRFSAKKSDSLSMRRTIVVKES